MIRTIFFDFDDTLGDREKYAYDCYKDVLKQSCDIQDPTEFEAVLQQIMLWDQSGDVNKEYVKQNLADRFGIVLPIEDFNAYWETHLWQYTVPFADAAETLDYLKEKYQISVITNGDPVGQRKKILTSGLSSYFDMDKITVSGDYPFKKPDPRVFYAACEKMDTKPEEAVYVGDIFARDVLGAYRAGLTPVWICHHHNRKCSLDIRVIHKISDLKDIY